MEATEHFRLMARFNRWVNAKVYGCVAGLGDPEYRRDRRVFFGSVHRTLNHLLVVDRLWTRRIVGADPGIRSLDQVLYDDFPSLTAARIAEDDQLTALVDGLDAAALDRPVRYQRMLGSGLEEARVGHILATLFNHQTHHRGQIHAMLTQSGLNPPDIDVIYYLEEAGLAGSAGTLDQDRLGLNQSEA